MALRQRIEQLEEQLVDIQVVVGTLESLARGGGAGAPARAPMGGASRGADPAQVEQLEMQVRALTQQVDQMSAQLRQQGGGSPAGTLAERAPPTRAPSGGFATTTSPADRDPISQIIGSNSVPSSRAGLSSPAPLPQATASDASSRQLYDTAYGLLLAQDYAAAETAFEEFLRRHANDALAGNAQYWLGETHFVRGNFKAAAAAFLKGYQTYGRSSKAPDSLLKLAMSLDRLGQRDAACSSYGELSIKFPNAPGAIRMRADNERRRLGCV